MEISTRPLSAARSRLSTNIQVFDTLDHVLGRLSWAGAPCPSRGKANDNLCLKMCRKPTPDTYYVWDGLVSFTDSKITGATRLWRHLQS